MSRKFFQKKQQTSQRPPIPPLPTNTTPINLRPRGKAGASTRLNDGQRDPNRHFSEKLRGKIFARDGHQCKNCGSSENLEADHIVPHSKGGRTNMDNAMTLCKKCNNEKSDTYEE